MAPDPAEEEKRDCLARWVIDHFDNWPERMAWLVKFGKGKPAVLADLKARIKREWEGRRNG